MLHLEFVQGDQRFGLDVPENISMSALKMLVDERLEGRQQGDYDFRVAKGFLSDEGTVTDQGLTNNSVIYLDGSRKYTGTGRSNVCGNANCTCAECQCTTACTCGN